MSIKGLPPKPEAERLNRMPPAFTPVEIKADGVRRGIDLPPIPVNLGTDWCDATKAWWETYRVSPQAKLMQETDWNVLVGAAIIHHRLNCGASVSDTAMSNLMAELRRREDAVGGTFEARAKLRITVVTDQTQEKVEADIDATAEMMVNYVERLTKKVSEKK